MRKLISLKLSVYLSIGRDIDLYIAKQGLNAPEAEAWALRWHPPAANAPLDCGGQSVPAMGPP